MVISKVGTYWEFVEFLRGRMVINFSRLKLLKWKDDCPQLVSNPSPAGLGEVLPPLELYTPWIEPLLQYGNCMGLHGFQTHAELYWEALGNLLCGQVLWKSLQGAQDINEFPRRIRLVLFFKGGNRGLVSSKTDLRACAEFSPSLNMSHEALQGSS
ncbi:hypothetical protein VNO77_34521 [Canavalia gladiata]|uniref:Uncharacterized protein n=1 Tax=Canavalia gladiata TaxID=3824 RepID=A0AAN9KHP1_CANGL